MTDDEGDAAAKARAKYRASDKYKATRAKYRASDKGKASQAKYRTSDEGMAVQARARVKYQASDKHRAARSKYRVSDKCRNAEIEYRASDAGRAVMARAQAKYRASDDGKAVNAEAQAKRRATLAGWNRMRTRALEKFGLSLDDFRRLVQQQSGKCAICGDPLQSWEYADERRLDGTQPVVDHCHRSDGSHSVRGILHQTCNSAIGLLGDDPENARRAWQYLERTRHARPLRPVAQQMALEVVK